MDSSRAEFVNKIIGDFPEFNFRLNKNFSFRPPKTIFYNNHYDCTDTDFKLLVLHEVSHALLKHRDFRLDVERVKMENEAWEKARELAIKYCVRINEDLIQEKLDSYRDWLYSKSKCKKCGLTRYQTLDRKYHCPKCEME